MTLLFDLMTALGSELLAHAVTPTVQAWNAEGKVLNWSRVVTLMTFGCGDFCSIHGYHHMLYLFQLEVHVNTITCVCIAASVVRVVPSISEVSR
jgi:fumarate reductase subunit D